MDNLIAVEIKVYMYVTEWQLCYNIVSQPSRKEGSSGMKCRAFKIIRESAYSIKFTFSEGQASFHLTDF